MVGLGWIRSASSVAQTASQASVLSQQPAEKSVVAALLRRHNGDVGLEMD